MVDAKIAAKWKNLVCWKFVVFVKNVAVLALYSKSEYCAKRVRVPVGPPLSEEVIGVEKVTSSCCKLWSVPVVQCNLVVQSCGFSMVSGVWYLFKANTKISKLFFFTGTAFGCGVYFAVDSAYSVGYAHQGPSGYKHMYLAKVLVGEFTKGNSGLKTAPLKGGGSSTDAFDTVVNDTGNPRIFVTFFDNQCYPEYLIAFQ